MQTVKYAHQIPSGFKYQSEIEQIVADLLAETIQRRRRVLLYQTSQLVSGESLGYARYLCRLLNGNLSFFRAEGETKQDLDRLIATANDGYDLCLIENTAPKHFLFPPVSCKVVQQLPISVLIMQRPYQSIKKILWVTRGQAIDEAAIEWLVQLAEPSQAAITLLEVLPQGPTLHSKAFQSYGLQKWLATDTPLGHQLRQLTDRLPTWLERGRLDFRRGDHQAQIEQEIAEVAPHLIVVAADPASWWQRRVVGDVVKPLLTNLDRPVLVAR